MENENLESLLIDYLDGTLTDEARVQVEERLAVDEAARTRYHQLKEVITAMRQSPDIDSPLSLRGKFEADLQSEMAQQDGPRIMRHSWALRIAAGVVLVLAGWSLGVWVTNTRQQNAELAALKAEMAANKKLMLAMLHNQESASTRVMGATVAYELAHSDDDIVQVLVQTLNADPNTNVRLAALEALEKFYQESHVRQALVRALPAQKDPVVQMALIRLLVRMKEKQIVGELEKITKDGQVIKAVKDEAHAGILKLS